MFFIAFNKHSHSILKGAFFMYNFTTNIIVDNGDDSFVPTLNFIYFLSET